MSALWANPFPASDRGMVVRDLLPRDAGQQAAAGAHHHDRSRRPDHNQPDYRLMLVFDAANNLESKEVCNGVTRIRPGQPGLLNVYAVYCRNDKALSETTDWTAASGSNDPRVGQLFKELFQVVFNDSQSLRPSVGDGNRK